jgi:hypothetical protein
MPDTVETFSSPEMEFIDKLIHAQYKTRYKEYKTNVRGLTAVKKEQELKVLSNILKSDFVLMLQEFGHLCSIETLQDVQKKLKQNKSWTHDILKTVVESSKFKATKNKQLFASLSRFQDSEE